ncbi:DegT/DnrJ/EryC1/StrS family aminotransferase [Streptomyces chilikensis]|uniref:DegT/DnrJ/EryC1/StrS family aminotransferase n=1 Tax=Streptomyces chilikensis TaxID=1194079 RepID=UPI003F4CCA74
MTMGVAGGAGARSMFRLERLEEAMRGRLGRECLYVPSCRLGLYLALRHWCRPGGRVLMSPVNDDVILFVVLAAGLRPVQAPLSPFDGTIDVDSVEPEVWRGLAGVLTANLYGNPDPAPRLRARCDELGIPLIEDAAHAIGGEVDGRPVGSVGAAASFSMSKHVGAGAGGILAFDADPALREELARARDALLEPARLAADLAHAARPFAEAAVRGPVRRRAARAASRLLGPGERDGIRMPLRAAELAAAAVPAPDLATHHSWVRVDMHDYRLAPGPLRARRIARGFGRLDEVLRAHREGTALLRDTEWAAPGASAGPVRPLFRVPLLVDDRDAAVAALARHGIVTGYLYDPPLDDYAGPGFTDLSTRPGPARHFARHALPVDPLRAPEAIAVLRRAGVRPAAAPVTGHQGAVPGAGGGGG